MDAYDGFDEFVTTRTVPLSRTAFLLTGDHHLAEDLLQVAMSRTAARWPQVRDGAPEAYVRRVMMNEFISWRRRRRYHERPVDTWVDTARAPDPSAEVVRRVVLGRALALLTPRERAVLVLRFYEDLSEQQAAEVLGWAVGTVKSRTHRALDRLRTVAPELADLAAEPNEVLA